MQERQRLDPRVVVTVAEAAHQAVPEVAERKNRLYADAIRRHGGQPILLDASSTTSERAAAFAAMDGLLLSGGADLDPARYGRPNLASRAMEPERDALEAQAWAAAQAGNAPVLGICRGFQALNVFLGGSLVQDVEGHAGAPWGYGPALKHPIRVVGGSRLARILFPSNSGGGVLRVNSYHHQGVRPADLAPGLVVSAVATSPLGELVEGFEATVGRLIFGVQCHPERAESTPVAFDRLWRFFVDACRGPARR